MSIDFKSEDEELRNEFSIHLHSGKFGATFSSPRLKGPTDQQPIILNVSYDPTRHLISGTATWDLSFMVLTGYAETLILGTKLDQTEPKVIAATEGLYAIPKSGSTLFFDPTLLSVRGDTILFEASLLVFTPGLPKFFTNYVTIKWPL
jgi:hypothetical protein